jgi:hypothetical protein
MPRHQLKRASPIGTTEQNGFAQMIPAMESKNQLFSTKSERNKESYLSHPSHCCGS